MLGAFVSGLVLCGAILLLATGGPFSSNGPQVAAIGGPFRLTNQEGQAVTDQDFRGRPFLAFFGFTHCPDVCPTTLFEVSEIFRSLGPDADRVRAVFFTVDPERDTPASLKEYLSSFDSRLSGLTGSLEDLSAVAKSYRAIYRKVPLEPPRTLSPSKVSSFTDCALAFRLSAQLGPISAAIDPNRYPSSPWSPFHAATTLSVYIWKLKSEGLGQYADEIAVGSAAVLIIVVLLFNVGARSFGRTLQRRYAGVR